MSLVSEAEWVHGYMSTEELAWLAGVALGKRAIVEIGALEGRSTRLLARACAGKVITVDLWRDEGVFARFNHHLKEEIAQGRLAFVRGASERSLNLVRTLLPEGRADMIFIDGNHEYEHVRQDILDYRQLLIPGGLLCGHDFDHRDYPGVRKAVEELVQPHKIAVRLLWYAPHA